MDKLHHYIASRLETNYFISHMGLTLSKVAPMEADIDVEVQKHHLQQNGFTHGGVIATLCDVATGIAAYTAAPEGKNVVTADLKISYLNPSTAPLVRAKGRVKKAGKLLFFCEAEVFDILEDGEKLVATATAIMVAVDIPLSKDASTR
jgi:uncharacterized protein (TIGR00369 family)